jgi:hypothetical protein
MVFLFGSLIGWCFNTQKNQRLTLQHNISSHPHQQNKPALNPPKHSKPVQQKNLDCRNQFFVLTRLFLSNSKATKITPTATIRIIAAKRISPYSSGPAMGDVGDIVGSRSSKEAYSKPFD